MSIASHNSFYLCWVKRIIAFIILLLFQFFPGQGQGVVFTESWQEAQELARSEGKYIFVEVYGDWCSACRNMEKNVFPLPEVGSIYNHEFINIRINGDDSSKDKLVDDWEIKAYPTLLIIDYDGSVLTRRTGFTGALDLISFGSEAIAYANEVKVLDPDAPKSMLKTFLLNYINISEGSKNAYLEKYFQDKKWNADSAHEDVKILIAAIPQASPEMINHLFQFFSVKENASIHQAVLKRLDARLQEMAAINNERDSIEKYHQKRTRLAQINPNNYPVSIKEIESQKEDDLLDCYKSNENWKEFSLLSGKIMDNRYMPLTSEMINRKDGFLNDQITPGNPRIRAKQITDHINDICISLYRFHQNKEELVRALIWINHSIEILPSARNYLIAAGLNNLLENHQEASLLISKAQVAKDYSEQYFMFEGLIKAYSEE